MSPEDLKSRCFESEIKLSASRSSGPGGQNVNKVNSKVELRFSVLSTLILTETEKELIITKLKNKINKEGEIVLVSQEARSQNENKVLVTEKFFSLMAKALTLPDPRKKTRPTLSSKVKRLDDKKMRGEVKRTRRSSSIAEE
jgi:ribosome-associated protein